MRYLALILVFLCSIIPAAHAQESHAQTLSMDSFKTIPVMHEGRIKPIDSFARITLKQLSGRENLASEEAAAWLARALFDPASAVTQPVFSIQSKPLKTRLGLDPNQTHFALPALQNPLRKTAPQIQTLLALDDDQLSAEQKELLQLHENVQVFVQIMRSFSMLLPLDLEIPEKYRPQIKGQKTYLSLSALEAPLAEELKDIIAYKGEDLNYYSAQEKQIAELSFQLNIFKQAGARNALLRVLPAQYKRDQGAWLSPWTILSQGRPSEQRTAYLSLWENAANAYRNHDAQNWRKSMDGLTAYINGKAPEVSAQKLQFETLYNSYNPYLAAIVLYGLSLTLILLSLFTGRWVYYAGLIALGFGAAIQSTGLALRIYILERPPVGTLYESVLFVSLICALAALLMTLIRRSSAITFAGIFAALSLLLIAPYLLQSGENMEMLMAVLNTNFWLSTHVLCITAGYGFSILTACIAHGYLFIRAAKPGAPALPMLQQSLYRISLIALLFMAVGTVLGGIWADQSWGRFWGWDPKENGALLICLWLIWVQHGRISAYLKPLHFTLALAYLNVIVALSWFGVNLLSVGLHSYGFTSGLADGLLLFCSAQSALLLIVWGLVLRRERTAPHVA